MTTQIDDRKRRESRDERLSKPKGRSYAEHTSDENWRSCKHLQSEADMHKSLAEDADEWVARYKTAEQYLDDRADGLSFHAVEDREHPSSGDPSKWFKGPPASSEPVNNGDELNAEAEL